jgi:hypothetical protein
MSTILSGIELEGIVSKLLAAEAEILHLAIEEEIVSEAPSESRFRKSEQDDKWSFCLTTAIVAVNRRNHEQTTPPEPLTGLQGEGGSGRRQGRSDDRSLKAALRRFSDREVGRRPHPRSM